MTKDQSFNRLTVILAVLAAVAIVVTGLLGAAPARAATVTKPVTVSLTFDDGDADQMPAAQVLQQNGLTGTFYIITGYLNAPGYMQQSDLATLAAAGNEIGGHSVTHPDMSALSQAEAQRQACQSRATLSSWGYTVRSFAYPFAESTTKTRDAVRACGYTSARGLGDVQTPYDCTGCVTAETLPPRNAMLTRAPSQVEADWTLADLQKQVTQAKTDRGGWVQLTFHHISDDTSLDPTTSPALFAQFAQWLAAYSADPANATTVKTVGDAVGTPVQPVVQSPVPGPAAPGVNAVQNPSFQTTSSTSPSGQKCWQYGGYGSNTAAFSTVSPGRTGTTTKATSLTVSDYTDGDAKWLPTFDLGDCAPTVVAGHTYSLREYYKANTVTQFTVYLRDSTTGSWHYWTSSPWYASATTWTQAVWTTDQIPAGFNGISFGLNLFTNGTLTTDDVAAYDTVGAPQLATTTTTTNSATTSAKTSSSVSRIAPAVDALAVRSRAVLGQLDTSGMASPLDAPAAPAPAAPAPAAPAAPAAPGTIGR